MERCAGDVHRDEFAHRQAGTISPPYAEHSHGNRAALSSPRVRAFVRVCVFVANHQTHSLVTHAGRNTQTLYARFGSCRRRRRDETRMNATADHSVGCLRCRRAQLGLLEALARCSLPVSSARHDSEIASIFSVTRSM